MAFINKGVTPAVFFGKLFEMRDCTHLMHLATKSYAQHMALGDFYDSLLDLADGIIESYQGIYGIIGFSPSTCEDKDPIKYLQASYSFIEGSRSIFKESWIQNQIDEILQLIASTLYKLKNLS